MTMYCNCSVCSVSPAQPNTIVQGRAELIPGAPLAMEPGSVLAHWSGAKFDTMQSIEIHAFQQRGHCLRTGSSFYYYRDGAPRLMPAQLKMLGLGGRIRYTVGAEFGGTLQVYQKVQGQPQEVTVMLGCGGTLSFNADREATGYAPNLDATPRLTLG
ncbi:MAG: hypothetical protein VYB65_13585 [Myxococcota bacterium]|nr:hypothetical protein [Myxococcota bacterium]